MKKLKFILSALMLTVCMSAFIGAGGATAFAYEGKQEPVAECAHEYTEDVVEGTCTTKGYTKYTCNLCGDTYTDNYTEVNGHKFGEIVIEPTCTHRGYTIHYCEDCGYEYSDSYVPATGHAYEAEEHSVNCTENGYTVYTCKNCGDEYTVDGEEAIEHDYEVKTVGRTCESYGRAIISRRFKDIGCSFSDKDPEYKDISSMILLSRVLKMIKDEGYKVNNVSAMIMAEKPKLTPYADRIKENLATALEIPVCNVGLSCTTLEGVGLIGTEQAMAASAVCTIFKNNK